MLDEPILGPGVDAPFLMPAEEPPVLGSIQALVHHEPFAVLCTQTGSQPYGSLVAFAFSEDLRSFFFATPMATRKYRLLSECDHVALLVDNRGRFPDDMMKVSAIAVTGRASQVRPGADSERWAGLSSAPRPCSTRSAWCAPPCGPMQRCSTVGNWPWTHPAAAWRSSSRDDRPGTLRCGLRA